MKKRNFKNRELQEFDRNNKQKEEKFTLEDFKDILIDALTESYKVCSYNDAKKSTEDVINNIIKEDVKGLHNIQTLIVALFTMTDSGIIKEEHNKDFVIFVKRMVDKLYYSEVKKSEVKK